MDLTALLPIIKNVLPEKKIIEAINKLIEEEKEQGVKYILTAQTDHEHNDVMIMVYRTSPTLSKPEIIRKYNRENLFDLLTMLK